MNIIVFSLIIFQIIVVILKLEGFIDFKWKAVFFCFWIFFCLLVVGNFIMILMIFSQMYEKVVNRNRNTDSFFQIIIII